MMKTDSPVRAHSESSDEGYKAFAKDKRSRTVRNNSSAIYSSHHDGANSSSESGERRHSYNPNFTRDNQLTERNRRYNDYNSSERTFNREGGYQRRERNFNNREERNFNREERGGYQRREGGYQPRERSFNNESGYQPRERNFNREERNFNREERGSYQRREGGYQPRERSFNNEGGYQPRERNFNREERNFNREERGSYQRREGGYQPRERSFNNEDGYQPRERNFNREERNFNREERGGYQKPRREGSKFGNRRTRKPESRDFSKQPKPKQFVNTANHYTLENYPSYAAPQQEGAIRLNRYISMSGICSRREADEYIAAGSITVNGQVVTELGSKVMPDDVVCYNGERIQNEKKVYIVMNKPKGFVTTLDDPHAEKSVMDLVKNACTERIYPVGRLDKNSVGVLLLTNDGDLAKKLTHPTYEKKKIYQVSLDKRLTRADMEQLILGVTLEDGDIAADDICYVEDSSMKNAVGIEIHSGRNRIVRRMFEHVGYHVGKLDRVYFAGLTKQKLKRGEWRFLTEKEVAMLKSGSYE